LFLYLAFTLHVYNYTTFIAIGKFKIVPA